MRPATLLVLLLVLASCGQPAVPDGLSPWKDVATPEQLKSEVSDAAGKPVIVKIWAEW